jgi:hypothetical protein
MCPSSRIAGLRDIAQFDIGPKAERPAHLGSSGWRIIGRSDGGPNWTGGWCARRCPFRLVGYDGSKLLT